MVLNPKGIYSIWNSGIDIYLIIVTRNGRTNRHQQNKSIWNQSIWNVDYHRPIFENFAKVKTQINQPHSLVPIIPLTCLKILPTTIIQNGVNIHLEISGRGRLNHIIVSPPAKTNLKYKRWTQNDSIVISSILENMEPDLVYQFLNYLTVKDL